MKLQESDIVLYRWVENVAGPWMTLTRNKLPLLQHLIKVLFTKSYRTILLQYKKYQGKKMLILKFSNGNSNFWIFLRRKPSWQYFLVLICWIKVLKHKLKTRMLRQPTCIQCATIHYIYHNQLKDITANKNKWSIEFWPLESKKIFLY